MTPGYDSWHGTEYSGASSIRENVCWHRGKAELDTA